MLVVILLNVIVANAKFSLLKLLIYEPYYLCLSRLECQAYARALAGYRDLRALPRSPSIRLGCHANCILLMD
jgi:hypothetical protein